jgi:hypothetical protein
MLLYYAKYDLITPGSVQKPKIFDTLYFARCMHALSRQNPRIQGAQRAANSIGI